MKELKNAIVQAAIAYEQNPCEVHAQILVKAVQDYKKKAV